MGTAHGDVMRLWDQTGTEKGIIFWCWATQLSCLSCLICVFRQVDLFLAVCSYLKVSLWFGFVRHYSCKCVTTAYCSNVISVGASGKEADLVASISFQSVSESLSYTLTGLSVCWCFCLVVGVVPALLVASALQRHQGQTLTLPGQMQRVSAASSGHFHQAIPAFIWFWPSVLGSWFLPRFQNVL